jgi:PTS system cellobiose-specific IIB component
MAPPRHGLWLGYLSASGITSGDNPLRLTAWAAAKELHSMTEKASDRKPIKVLMVCAMGMSSSLLENKTKEAAAKAGIPFELKAVAVQEIVRWDPAMTWYDMVLVAPQVFYKRKAIEQTASPHGILVQPISAEVFGMVDGEALLQQILTAIQERDEAKKKGS